MQVKKPDFKIFAGGAEDGELHDFPDVARGWGVTKLQTNKKPPLSWMNGAFNRVDNNFYYLLQNGLVEWNPEIEYSVGALSQVDGVIYRAKEAVKGENPTASAKWEKLFSDKVGTSDFIGMSQNAVKKELDKKVSAADLTQTITEDKLKAPSNFAVFEAIEKSSISTALAGTLFKPDLFSPCFVKKAANEIFVKAGTSVILKTGKVITYEKDTPVSHATHEAGSDYAIIVDSEGKLTAKLDNFETPAHISEADLILGGYHYGLVKDTETVESGEFSTYGKGMIWTQDDVNKVRGINEFSIWDIKFRADGIVNSTKSPRFGQLSNHGMAFDKSTRTWYAIYYVSTDVDKYGVSRSGTNIASETDLPLVRQSFGGNGAKKYDNLNWWTANELVASHGARLLWEHEFNSRAFGVTENKVAGGAQSTYPKTERIKGLTSRLGWYVQSTRPENQGGR